VRSANAVAACPPLGGTVCSGRRIPHLSADDRSNRSRLTTDTDLPRENSAFGVQPPSTRAPPSIPNRHALCWRPAPLSSARSGAFPPILPLVPEPAPPPPSLPARSAICPAPAPPAFRNRRGQFRGLAKTPPAAESVPRAGPPF